jgi:hypothetical protein
MLGAPSSVWRSPATRAPWKGARSPSATPGVANRGLASTPPKSPRPTGLTRSGSDASSPLSSRLATRRHRSRRGPSFAAERVTGPIAEMIARYPRRRRSDPHRLFPALMPWWVVSSDRGAERARLSLGRPAAFGLAGAGRSPWTSPHRISSLAARRRITGGGDPLAIENRPPLVGNARLTPESDIVYCSVQAARERGTGGLDWAGPGDSPVPGVEPPCIGGVPFASRRPQVFEWPLRHRKPACGIRQGPSPPGPPPGAGIPSSWRRSLSLADGVIGAARAAGVRRGSPKPPVIGRPRLLPLSRPASALPPRLG